jgi:hypothetical protein
MPPPAPPLDCTLAELHEWFEALRAVDMDVTRFAVAVTLEYLTRAGVKPHEELAGATDWKGFALYLMLTLWPALEGDGDRSWLRALMADLVEISIANPSDNRLAELLAQFVQWSSPTRARETFIALLPPEAEPALRLIDDWKGEDRRRQEEGGY